LELAHKAVSLEKTAYTMATLAAACAETGDFARAVVNQQEALKLLPENVETETRRSFEEQLAAFQAGRPWREQSQGKP
jgi:cytochrome c-type biogenesis protein CcmH/NrfG